MPRPRAPWWMYGVAVSVLCYLVLMLYADCVGPGSIGARLRFVEGQAVVMAVAPGHPAERGGLSPGDHLLTASGQPMPTLFHWRVVASQARVGQPFPLQVERGGARSAVQLSFRPHWHLWTWGTWAVYLAKVATQLIIFGLGVVVGFSRPRDLVAVVGAWFLASYAITNILPIDLYDPHAPTFPYGFAAIWRDLPVPVWPALWVALLSFLLGPLLLVVFFALFPRPLVLTTRWAWLTLGAVLLSITGWSYPRLVHLCFLEIHDPERALAAVSTQLAPRVGAAVLAAVAVGMILLVLNYRRLDSPNERRRVRLVVLGALLGLVAPGIVAVSGLAGLPADLQTALQSPVVRPVTAFLHLVFPVALAYAIVRHRLFDIRLMIRQGLQYAFARNIVASFVPACAALLLIDLLLHGDQPLRSVVQTRGWIYAGVAGVALLAHARQQQWLAALDRRFFRERYDANRLLRGVVEEVREGGSLERVAPRIAAQLESALHPEFAALLVREPADSSFHVMATVPPDKAPPSIPAESKLVGMARLLGRPIDLGGGDSGWVKDQLPGDDTAFVRRARLGLLVPVPTPEGSGQEALLALGLKRSEEPYSKEDQEMMAAVAGSVGLLLARAGPARRESAAFAECPRCGTCYETDTHTCTKEGAALTTVRLPRLLAQRYRLERRLGRGGMGTVYEALDTELERPVAVKVIREELVGSSDAADRFRREARAAAAFSHPNVVTVHDFGIAAETRAFLVMELLRGATLREILRGEGRVSPARTLAIARDICAAAEAAHRRQLVHRDLKPENVFLVRDESTERAKVLDFGIAKFLATDTNATRTQTSAILGTPHYMGPEQLRGGAADSSWDLWALAVLTYEMLTGALPFAASTAADYQVAVLSGQFTPASTHLGTSTPGLDAFFRRVFSADPALRPDSAPHFAAELEQALADAASAVP